MWVFGYGSLVWRPDFDFAERRVGWIAGHARRFWQGSPDHRGVPGAPGRVVTLVPAPGERCWGVAYRLEGAQVEAVLARLDHREIAGYERHEVTVHPRAGASMTALMYLANADNPSWLGPAPLEAMATHIVGARGPSGTNAEYVLELARALEGMGVRDPHVEAVAAAVRASLAANGEENRRGRE